MQNFVFIVNCERIKKQGKYRVYFRPNDQLTDRIKALPSGTKKWITDSYHWEITTRSLYEVIKIYKRSSKIKFDFGSDDGKKAFLEQIIKLDKDRKEKESLLVELNKKKVYWSEYKAEIEKDYKFYIDKTHENLKEGVQLYPHQVTTAIFIDKVRNALISHEMGVGKTLESIAYVEMNDFNKVFVITPNSLKFNFYDEIVKFTNSKAHIINWRKNSHSIEEAKYIIVNYEFFNTTLKNRKKMDKKFKDLNIGKIDCLICDECFTYDTLIDTDKGKLKIGDIVKNKLDVKVLSYNHRLKKIETKSIKKYLYNGYKDVINVTFSNGETIECTPNHNFYSYDRDKYIPIKDFKYGEKIIKKKKDTYKNNGLFGMQKEFQTKKVKSNILFKKMFNKIYWKIKGKKSTIMGNKNLPSLWMWDRIFGFEKKKEKILFNKLFSKMENGTTRNKKENTQQRNIQENINCYKESNTRKPKSCLGEFKKNENKQSYVQTGEYRKNEKKENRSNIFIKRWKWTINKTTIKTFFKPIRNNKIRNENGIFTTNKKTITRNGYSCGFTTYPLQSGYWFSIFKTINRNRWKFSQKKKMEIFGQEKNGDIEIVRVESIEVLESGNRRKFGCGGKQNKKVYDLEISDNHNYFANNILVSNSHRVKNTKSNTYKNFKRIFKKDIDSKVFLSGTPAPNKAAELYTVLNQISPLEFPTKDYFYKNYLGMEYDPDTHGGWVKNPTMENLEQLYHNIEPYTHRKRKQEVLKDLPDKIFQKVILEMTPKQVDIYEDVEQGIANEYLNEYVELPITRMLRSRQYTSSLKIKTMIEFINRMLDEGEKIVVMDYFTKSLIELKTHYGEKACLHIGDYSVEDRRNMVREFQDPTSDIKIFLGTIQTSKEGLTLTAANKIFLMTLPYVPGEFDQVIDRLHRIGQKDVVNAYFLIFLDTIDEYVFDAIERKQKEISKVIDNVDFESNVGESVMGEVMAKIAKKHESSMV